MNTDAFLAPDNPTQHHEDDLLIEVDFKWLMAGQGCWVDPARLKSDPGYAESCLHAALNSSCEALRLCAACLREELKGLGAIHPCNT